MRIEAVIAGRYLFAKKSHNVINVISAISAAGIAVGTAAIIIILSVYNGFDRIIKDNLCDLDPDILIVPRTGRFFDENDSRLESLSECEAETTAVLEDNIFFSYGDKQGIALAKGVDDSYIKHSGLGNHIVEGDWRLRNGDFAETAIGSSLAYANGIHSFFSSPLNLYYPDSGKDFSPSDPSGSLHSAQAYPSCLVSINAEIDERLMIVPIELMRNLVNNGEKACSALELRFPNGEPEHFKQNHHLEGFRILDRYEQHPSLYRMMKLEKAAIYLILVFVVIIVAFNIFSSLSMLRIEKEEDVKSLVAMGAGNNTIKRIFTLEGWMISLFGMVAGLIPGVVAVMVQKAWGIVKMPGNFLVSSYPVELQAGDIVLTIVGVAAVGLSISLAAAAKKL